MAEFNKGDRVIVVRYNAEISDEGKSFIIGQPGTVVKAIAALDAFRVEMDNEILGITEWALYRNELEKLL